MRIFSLIFLMICCLFFINPQFKSSLYQAHADSESQYWHKQYYKIGIDEILIIRALKELKSSEEKGQFLLLNMMDIPATTALNMVKDLNLKKQNKVIDLYKREKITPSVALEAVKTLGQEELSGMLALYRGGFWDMSAITAIKFLKTPRQRAMAILLKQSGFDDLFAVNGGMSMEMKEVDSAIYLKKNGLSAPLSLYFATSISKELQDYAITLHQEGKSHEEILRIILEKSE